MKITKNKVPAECKKIITIVELSMIDVLFLTGAFILVVFAVAFGILKLR